jgi:DNA-binding XRE family transcriptional regulator
MKKKIDSTVATFDELLKKKYGQHGTPSRDQFEADAEAFILSECLKAARRQAKLTQEELAVKVGTKKSYISRLENGKSDIQLATLRRIIEQGLGRKMQITIL